MAKNKILYIVAIVLILIVISGGLFFFLGDRGIQKEAEVDQMVDCSREAKGKRALCFMEKASTCLPVTFEIMTKIGLIEITALGVENEKCHFQGKINNVVIIDCYFLKGILSPDILFQIGGDDKGLQKVVDDSCIRKNND